MSARGLVKTFGTLRAVDDVSFEIARGEILGIVGESGSGKSTTGKMCLGLMKPDAGTVSFDGTDLASLNRRAMRTLRSRLQVVPQNPQTSLNPRLTIAGSLHFNMRAHGIETSERRRLTFDLLDRVGLTSAHAERYPHQLSGGQLQRVAIARALATSPDLVVCDEAVSALDKSVQAQVLNLIADLQKDLGVAFMFISHDLAVIEHICDNVVVMYHGKLVEQGSAQSIWRAPAHEYTASLLEAIPGKSLFMTA